MVLNPIKRVVIHEAVMEQISEYIIKENIQPGDRLLSERKLAELLQVSRNSIREALKALASQDILEIKHGGGTFLKIKDSFAFAKHNSKFSKDLKVLNELIAAREMIEVYTAKKAAEIATPDQISWLYEVVEDDNKLSKEYLYQQKTDYFPNLTVEISITSLLNNELLVDTHKKIEILWKQCWNSANSTPLTLETRYSEHKDIIKAIASGNRKAVEAIVIEHLQSIKTVIGKFAQEEKANKSK